MHLAALLASKSALLAVASLTAMPAWAQDATEQNPTELADRDNQDETSDIETIIVTATRAARPLSSIPGAVYVIGEAELDLQLTAAPDISGVLDRQIPGLLTDQGNVRQSNLSNARGRDLLILLDGVQVGNPGGLDEDLSRIDGSLVERIEFVATANSLYGLGATGGVVNIITKRPDAGETRLTSEVLLNFQPTNVAESVGGQLTQTIQTASDDVDFIGSASVNRRQTSFDPDGDPIPSVFGRPRDENASYSLFGKLGVRLSDTQRLELGANIFHREVAGNFFIADTTGVVRGEKPGVILCPPSGCNAVTDGPIEFNSIPRQSSINLTANYSNDNFLADTSSLRILGYYQDTFQSLGNAEVPDERDSERYGLRLDVDTDVPRSEIRVNWGLDLEQASHRGRFAAGIDLGTGAIIPAEEADPLETLVYFNAPTDRLAAGIFAQATVPLFETLTLSGGVRHEVYKIEVVEDFLSQRGGVVTGGSFDYDSTVINAGLVWSATERLDLFTAYSQGFNIESIARLFRRSSINIDVEESSPKPVRVDSYELGARWNADRVRLSLTGYFNESDLGSRCVTVALGAFCEPTRAPERFWGVESSIDAEVTESLDVGATLAYADGEQDLDGDGIFTAAPNDIVSPLKLTGYVSWQATSFWRSRLQALYVGSREGAEDGFVLDSPDAYAVLDWLNTLDLPRGSLTVSVSNLLNESYVAPRLQAFNGPFQVPNPGRTVALQYRIDW